MEDKRSAGVATNTAMRIGTSNLVPPPQSVPSSMAHQTAHQLGAIPIKPPQGPAIATPSVPSPDLQKSMTPAALHGINQTAATPLVGLNVQSTTPLGSQPRRSLPGGGAVEHRACNCRNSKCLKLYCECFASGRYCNSCNCSNCMNNKDHEQARSRAIETILERNPNAFRPKIQIQQGEDGIATAQVTRHSKGCSCRKSNCLKKYCECFQAGICCASTCRCKDCRNYEGSQQLLAVMRRDDGDTAQRNGSQSLSDCKRPRIAGRPGTNNGMHSHQSMRQKHDPAREAIKSSRDKRMHEVLATMLTTLHTEAWSNEQGRRDEYSQQPEECAAPGNSEAAMPKATDKPLSNYYIETEGVLLGEFGSFLGKLADKIDEQMTRNDG